MSLPGGVGQLVAVKGSRASLTLKHTELNHERLILQLDKHISGLHIAMHEHNVSGYVTYCRKATEYCHE